MRAEVVRVESCVFRPVAGSAVTGAGSEETGLWNDYELAVVADPGAGLVGRAEALQLAVTGMEEPAAAAFIRLRAPVGHPERPRDQRQRVPPREAEVRVRSLPRIHEIHRPATRSLGLRFVRHG